jgi:hypothetical protein
MRPAFHHDLAMARVADLCRHAAMERTAKAARSQARHRTWSVLGHAVTGLGRRVLRLARGRRPAPAR